MVIERIKQSLVKKNDKKLFSEIHYSFHQKYGYGQHLLIAGKSNVHYQDWEWYELKQQVDEAHENVLNEHKEEDIYKAIHKKSIELKL